MLATAVTQWGQNQNEIASFFAKKKEKKTKGQLISKCPYEKSVSSKIPTKKFPRFLPYIASKERSNQKNEGTLLY